MQYVNRTYYLPVVNTVNKKLTNFVNLKQKKDLLILFFSAVAYS